MEDASAPWLASATPTIQAAVTPEPPPETSQTSSDFNGSSSPTTSSAKAARSHRRPSRSNQFQLLRLARTIQFRYVQRLRQHQRSIQDEHQVLACETRSLKCVGLGHSRRCTLNRVETLSNVSVPTIHRGNARHQTLA